MSVVQDTVAVNTATAGALPTRDELLHALHEQQALNTRLHNTLNENEEVLGKKSNVIDSQQTRINVLEEYLRILRQKRFGSSSEKNLLQPELFDDLELLADGDSDVSGELDEEESPEQALPRKRRGKKALSASLPRIQVLRIPVIVNTYSGRT